MEPLFQIVFYQSLFLLAYQLIKKSPFFQLNRFYLLGSLIASFVLPFLDLNWFQFQFPSENLSQLQSVYLPEVFIGESNADANKLFQPTASVGYWPILENLYWVGFAVAFSLLYIKVERLVKLIQENLISEEKQFKIVQLNQSKEAFSFYHYIFLGKEMHPEERASILLHEQQHVRLKHSIDNSLVAILRVVMWFNPLLYLYQKELQLLHEYQADAKAFMQMNPKKYIYQLLNTAFQTQNMGLMSSFYYKSFIKNRITMLQKKKSKKLALLKYAIITPILIVLVSFTAIAQEALPEDEQALLEKYKKEIKELRALDDKESIRELTKNLEKDDDGILTKESYYRLTASILDLLENRKSKRDDLNEDFESLMRESFSQKYDDYKEGMKNKLANNEVVDAPFKSIKEVEKLDVPFASVDQVPIYPGCEEGKTNKDLRECMVEMISNHVNENFDTSIGKKLGLTGINRVYVRFKIAASGEVTDVTARATHPDLSDAGEAVINKLPKMKPGMHKGEAVNVIYTLPITFMIPEKDVEEE